MKNIKEWKNSTCWLVLVLIVKLWFSVLLNLKSHIIAHPRVTNDWAPTNPPTKSFDLPPCHHVTVSVTWFAPCHHISQAFDLPLPPHQSVIWLVLYYHITTSPCYYITTLVSHLTCPLPLHQSVIWLALYHCITMLLHFCITTLVSHLTCPLPPHQSVIWLALYYCLTTLLCDRMTSLLHHCISQSFDLPPATTPVSPLTCQLPPHQSVILLPLYHCFTALPH